MPQIRGLSLPVWNKESFLNLLNILRGNSYCKLGPQCVGVHIYFPPYRATWNRNVIGCVWKAVSVSYKKKNEQKSHLSLVGLVVKLNPASSQTLVKGKSLLLLLNTVNQWEECEVRNVWARRCQRSQITTREKRTIFIMICVSHPSAIRASNDSWRSAALRLNLIRILFVSLLESKYKCSSVNVSWRYATVTVLFWIQGRHCKN